MDDLTLVVSGVVAGPSIMQQRQLQLITGKRESDYINHTRIRIH